MNADDVASGGPVAQQIAERAPFGPMERLGHDDLVTAQRTTLATPRRRAGAIWSLCVSNGDLVTVVLDNENVGDQIATWDDARPDPGPGGGPTRRRVRLAGRLQEPAEVLSQ